MAPRLRLWVGLAAALLFQMFTYQFGANPPIDYPRFLIADTVDEDHIFEDSEITMATRIEQLTWQSGMFWSYPAGANLPSTPVPYRRVAANLLDSIAANKSRLSSVIAILDVKLSPEKAAEQVRSQAAALREVEDDAGAFVIIEQVHDVFSFRQRFWSQVQRMQGAG